MSIELNWTDFTLMCHTLFLWSIKLIFILLTILFTRHIEDLTFGKICNTFWTLLSFSQSLVLFVKLFEELEPYAIQVIYHTFLICSYSRNSKDDYTRWLHTGINPCEIWLSWHIILYVPCKYIEPVKQSLLKS